MVAFQGELDSPKEPPAEMRELVRRLDEAADAYYAGRGELMSDYEWDALFDRLKALEEETGIVMPSSPTHKVSSASEDASSDDAKEPHEFSALSLAKTKKIADLAKWADSRTIWISWKLDGLTLVATYDGGKLVKLLTRGDGITGTNITRLAPAIAGLPREIEDNGHIVVRGEAVISYSDFREIIAETGEDYANPRNLASGSLSLKDVEQVAARRIRWIPFTPVKVDAPSSLSWGAKMSRLEELGFKCVEREKIESPDVARLEDAIARWTAKVTRGDNPYPVDGLVVCYDDTAYASTGSVTGHHATRAGLAFKWADESAETELVQIEWSCAISSISPVAVFKPVELEGTTVRRAMLCNVSECERLGIGAKGTKIEVIKANKIIPKIVKVTEAQGEFTIPSSCPVCGESTELYVSTSDTKTLRCTNPQCPAKALRKFMRFVSKEGMDIDGLAGETLAKFINRSWLRTLADVYRLGEHSQEIADMEGFGDKSAANITAAIAEAKKRSAVNFIVSLSIPLCGREVARRLLSSRSTLRELVDDAKKGADFSSIDGIGEAKSASFVKWFADPANAALVEDLLSLVEIEEFAPPPKTGSCAGLVFVITGDVHHWANRAELKSYIESQGGKVSGNVSAKTSYLINNDAESTSGKNRKAKELSIPIITEEQFRERF